MCVLKSFTGLRRRLALLVALLVLPAFALLALSAIEQTNRSVSVAQDTALGYPAYAVSGQLKNIIGAALNVVIPLRNEKEFKENKT